MGGCATCAGCCSARRQQAKRPGWPTARPATQPAAPRTHSMHPPSFMTSSYCSTVLSPLLGVQCAATQLREQPVGKAMPAFSPFSSISLRTAGGRAQGLLAVWSSPQAPPATRRMGRSGASCHGCCLPACLPACLPDSACGPPCHAPLPNYPQQPPLPCPALPSPALPAVRAPESSSRWHRSVMRIPGLAIVCTYDRTWRCTSAAWRTCGGPTEGGTGKQGRCSREGRQQACQALRAAQVWQRR